MAQAKERKLHERIDAFGVLCEECQRFRIFDHAGLIERFGMRDPSSLTFAVASALYGCPRAAPDTHFSERCGMRPYSTRYQDLERAQNQKPYQPTPRDVRSWELIVAVCLECRHVSEVKRWNVSKEIGPDTPIVSICKRLKCSGCQTRGKVQLSIVKLERGPR